MLFSVLSCQMTFQLHKSSSITPKCDTAQIEKSTYSSSSQAISRCHFYVMCVFHLKWRMGGVQHWTSRNFPSNGGIVSSSFVQRVALPWIQSPALYVTTTGVGTFRWDCCEVFDWTRWTCWILQESCREYLQQPWDRGLLAHEPMPLVCPWIQREHFEFTNNWNLQIRRASPCSLELKRQMQSTNLQAPGWRNYLKVWSGMTNLMHRVE